MNKIQIGSVVRRKSTGILYHVLDVNGSSAIIVRFLPTAYVEVSYSETDVVSLSEISLVR